MQIAVMLLKTSSLRPPVLQLISFTNTAFPQTLISNLASRLAPLIPVPDLGYEMSYCKTKEATKVFWETMNGWVKVSQGLGVLLGMFLIRKRQWPKKEFHILHSCDVFCLSTCYVTDNTMFVKMLAIFCFKVCKSTWDSPKNIHYENGHWDGYYIIYFLRSLSFLDVWKDFPSWIHIPSLSNQKVKLEVCAV